MAQLLSFLGKGGVGRTTIAIASAKKLAQQGARVLLAGQDPSPAFGVLLGVTPSGDPQTIEANLSVVQLQSTLLLEKAWEEVKQLEAKYLRSPTLRNVYGQELSILPGMDTALALNAIREYNQSGLYDVIIYDGSGNLTELRMLGIPETASWYIRRFRQVFLDSDLGQAISPFVQPVTAAIFNTSWSFDNLAEQPTNEANSLLNDGKAAIADPTQIAVYLVATRERAAQAMAKYLWGSAQQVGVTVAGVLLNSSEGAPSSEVSAEFAPLPITPLPQRSGDEWQSLIDALPNLRETTNAPKPLSVDVANREVRIFLPGFDKKQAKLTQYGPEITVEAGDQRRNIELPGSLRGQAVKGAKFQDGYLIVSF